MIVANERSQKKKLYHGNNYLDALGRKYFVQGYYLTRIR